MDPDAAVNSPETVALLERARAGNRNEALGELFAQASDRLERMVWLRLDRRLRGRIDASDVLQEAFIEAMKGFPKYLDNPVGSFFVWLRCIAGRTLMDLHRFHLGAQARDARREISIDGQAIGGAPAATSEAIAAQLLGRITSPTEVARRAERRVRLLQILEHMDPIDREVLALRHFEQLSNSEVAEVLDIRESAASKRHIRALRRLKERLAAEGAELS